MKMRLADSKSGITKVTRGRFMISIMPRASSSLLGLETKMTSIAAAITK